MAGADDDERRRTVLVVAQRIVVPDTVGLTCSCDELFHVEPSHHEIFIEMCVFGGSDGLVKA